MIRAGSHRPAHTLPENTTPKVLVQAVLKIHCLACASVAELLDAVPDEQKDMTMPMYTAHDHFYVNERMNTVETIKQTK